MEMVVLLPVVGPDVVDVVLTVATTTVGDVIVDVGEL